MDEDEDLTGADADELFEKTRPIGEAIHILAEAELTVAAVDELSPAERIRVDRAWRNALDIVGE